jgi:hypothetical protein
MKSTVVVFVGAILLGPTSNASDSKFDFACQEVKALVDLMENGPTDVINQAADDPVQYRDHSIRGWTCLMTPLPPLRHGRPYLKSLDCYADNGDSHVNEQALSASGETFKRNMDPFHACFRGSILTEAPVSYTDNHRGEGIRAVLSNTYQGHHIIIQYGYLWDQIQTGRIVWQTIIGYGE